MSGRYEHASYREHGCRISPLERRLLLAMVSLMRDREPDGQPLDDHYAEHVWLNLRDVYEHCYVIKPDQSHELQCRNQRQALRRALGRLFDQGLISAMALAWVNLEDHEILDWQGGGREEHKSSEHAWRYGRKTPNWRRVILTEPGIKLAQLLEAEAMP